ncbi:c-type heme family protein [Roseiconus lacunae]|uniref:c-type heme family protein n=2 Tax=Roseiconus lacunae TaxID=2605694 RepID=UPI001F2EBCA2|nr:DUF3365 domain-containing protein [Roseiconus lacunae]
MRRTIQLSIMQLYGANPMNRPMNWTSLVLIVVLLGFTELGPFADGSLATGEDVGTSGPAEAGDRATPQAPTTDEARGRARLMHELIHGSLQVMHRDFFDEDDAAAIPSSSLEDVFEEMLQTHHVKIRWLIVDTDIVNVDHEPEDDFEEAAVRALKKGNQRFESVENGRYRYVGAIRLASQCLKCHVKHRADTQDRVAGLSISMAVKTP